MWNDARARTHTQTHTHRCSHTLIHTCTQTILIRKNMLTQFSHIMEINSVTVISLRLLGSDHSHCPVTIHHPSVILVAWVTAQQICLFTRPDPSDDREGL